MQSAQQEIHEVWLQCMQMNQCSPQAAISFLHKVRHLLNTPLTHSGQTLLMLAASTSSINLIKAALQYQPNTQLKDHIGRTALHYAAAVGSSEIFQLLVKFGANPNELTIGGETPLIKACTFCQGDIIEWYLNNSIPSFEITDKMGKKPLDVLKLSGQALFEEVQSIYNELQENKQNAMRQ